MDWFSPLDWKKSEIAFVAGVLVVLVSISYFQLRVGQEKTRDAQRRADLELIARSLDAYMSDHKILPPASSDSKIVACGDLGDKACNWDTGPVVDAQGVAYINKLPVDPFASRGWQYIYTVSENRLNYKIFTRLEYSRDPSYRTDLTVTCGNNVQCNWYVAN